MAAHLRARLKERRARAARRAARLLELMPEARHMLTDHHGASRVPLFGSLVQETSTETSDVDPAVEGLKPDCCLEALAQLRHPFSVPVDLVRLDEAPSSLIERIQADGREL